MQEDGDGIVIFGVTRVCSARKRKCSIIGCVVNVPSLPVTRSIIGFGLTPWNLILRSPETTSTPGSAPRKS